MNKIDLYFCNFKSIILNNKYKTGWQADNIDGYEIRSLYHKYNTMDRKNCTWESHRKTIDLQFCYSGSEMIYFSENNKNFKRNKYLENMDKDLWFKNENINNHIILKPNTFVIFLTNCLHLPQVKTMQDLSIEKIVLKIPLEML